MDRRTYLQSVATTGTVALTAGCLGNDGAEGTVLGPPDRDLSDAAHPSYGDEMPDFSVPDPITGETVSPSALEGDRSFLWTSFYTNCPDGVCPALILRLRRAQEVAAEKGYGDDAAFLAMTFDPERDTADVLRTYADQQGVDLDAGNWHFLRPESYEAGKELLDEKFGLVIEKVPANSYENLEYQFPHYGLILLVNDRGIVERAYPNGASVDIETVERDFETVVTA
ncbi:SCO family protein [Halorubrum sp. SD683]|uniref:SCO family protein n=1 Tax=Halorubrum sp. SD683 TaxID=1855873 RepID=UPI000A2EB2D8|nr:SCO family protein [Halorubrum sp. SD683]OTF01748.1 electron transporter SenC [Halorubrum sp. SD683]